MKSKAVPFVARDKRFLKKVRTVLKKLLQQKESSKAEAVPQFTDFCFEEDKNLFAWNRWCKN